MTKRIVSGVFLLVALGALGLILAGALTSGEQLIVRFLTAVIVAALALYVISDLRLQRDGAGGTISRAAPVTPSRVGGARLAGVHAESTAAFMATVTGKKSAANSAAETTVLESSSAPGPRPSRLEAPESMETAPATESPAVTLEGGSESGTAPNPASVSLEGDEKVAAWSDPDVPSDQESSSEDASSDDEKIAERLIRSVPALADDEPYSHDSLDADQWPPVPEGQVSADGELELDEAADDDIDGLVAIFTKQAEQELKKAAAVAPRQELALAAHGSHSPDLVSDDNGSSFDAARTDDPAAEIPTLTLDRVVRTLHSTPIHSTPSHSDSSDGDSSGSTPGKSSANTKGNGGSAGGSGADSAGADSAGADSPSGEDPFGDDSESPRPVVALAPDLGPVTAERPVSALEAAGDAHARVIDLRLSADTSAEIEEAIRAGEIEVISSLIEKGDLSADGPISDDDVQTMVYVAFTSNELRKILQSGGIIDGDASDLDLGPVEVFTEESHGAILRLSLPGPSPVADVSVIELRESTTAVEFEAETDGEAGASDTNADEASAVEDAAETSC